MVKVHDYWLRWLLQYVIMNLCLSVRLSNAWNAADCDKTEESSAQIFYTI